MKPPRFRSGPRQGAVASLLIALLLPGVARPDCPPVRVECSFFDVRWIDESPARVSCYEFEGLPLASTSHDLARGLVHAGGGSNTSTSYTPEILTTDRFWIEGAEAGTPVTFRARLTVDGDAYGQSRPNCCHGGARARFLVDGEASETAEYCNSSTCTNDRRILERTVERAVGEVFELSVLCQIWGWEGGGGYVATALSFLDLPSGTGIRSCRGFQQDAPVEALRTSWGSLKSTYR